MEGHITGEMAEQELDGFRAALAQTRSPCWIIDQLGLQGFNPSAVNAGARWFEAFRAYGGKEIVIVSHLSAARMVAATLAFSARTKVAMVGSLDEAYARVGLDRV